MNAYLKKYGFQSPKITTIPNQNLGIVVVIPCFNETRITQTLDSLNRCGKTTCEVKTIVVINQSEIITEEIAKQNQVTYEQVIEWKSAKPEFDLEVIFEKALPKKHAGVGLARKIGMDEAVNLFHQIERDGIIVTFDADCLVETNYLLAIEAHFIKHPKSPGCSIRYSHPINGGDYSQHIYDGIINYELHLRYYNQAMKYCGAPYAFHTVGSSMAVKSSAYQKQGGMNKRKAGEDFYFLQKIIELGGFTELNATCVIPSPRISDRVPFGTGKAIGDWVEKNDETYYTYSFQTFIELKELFLNIANIYNKVDYVIKSKLILQYMKEINFENKVGEIRNNTTNYINFEKRFYTFFNAFMVLKYVHYARDNFYPNLPVQQEAKQLLIHCFQFNQNEKNPEIVLQYYRSLEKGDGLVIG